MESSTILKKALKSKIHSRGDDIEEGDWIYYRKNDGKSKSTIWNGPSKVTAINGKKLFIDQGARLGTVNRDDAVRIGEEFWRYDNLKEEENCDDVIHNDCQDSDDTYESSDDTEENNADEERDEGGMNEENSGDEEGEKRDNTDGMSSKKDSSQEGFSYEKIKASDIVRYQNPQTEVVETVKVLSRAAKSTGPNKFWWNVKVQDTGEMKSVDTSRMNDVQKVQEAHDVDTTVDTLVVSIPRYMYNEPKCIAAKEKELKNWDDFGVYIEVEDIGQETVNTNWVLVKKDDGVKARLCIRGDQEKNKENVKTDSPTVNKVNVKLFYLLAAYFGWSVRTADVKAAFLQGADLDRDVYVRPPKERRVPGIIWKMLKRVYGFVDASRGFYLELNQMLLELGCKASIYDPALYMYVKKDGSLGGMVLTHVDDLIHGSGDDEFYNNVMVPLKEKFQFGREEEGDFKYVGMHVKQEKDHIITDQDQYVDTLEVPNMKLYEDSQDIDNLLSEECQSDYRAAVGRIGWIANTSRPDLAYDNLVLSTKLGKAQLGI